MAIKETPTVTEALQKLQLLCSRQEKCPSDVIILLKRWGIDREHHHEIIEKLKSDNYIDEHRYTTAFVRDKIQFDHWGMIKIGYFLKQKGISNTIIEKAFQEFDRNKYREMIGKELAKRRKSLKGSPREIWAKLARYGSSRGYEMEMMKDFLDKPDGGK
jgi:regulatory protein